ncbi:MAG: hypothetical protein WAM82_09495 [Thermoanaerobaculia bacterium]
MVKKDDRSSSDLTPLMVPPATFNLNDYAPAVSYALLATIQDQGVMLDRSAAAERRKDFERTAREVVAGLQRMLKDIQEKGILEDNLAIVRRTAGQELLAARESIAYADRELPFLRLKIKQVSDMVLAAELAPDREKALRDIQVAIDGLESFRDTVSIVHEGYRAFLEAHSAITPKRLSAKDFATLRQVDELRAMVAALPQAMAEADATRAREAEDEFSARRALGLLGGLILGLPSLYIGGPIVALIGSAVGALLALRLYPSLKGRGA